MSNIVYRYYKDGVLHRTNGFAVKYSKKENAFLNENWINGIRQDIGKYKIGDKIKIRGANENWIITESFLNKWYSISCGHTAIFNVHESEIVVMEKPKYLYK